MCVCVCVCVRVESLYSGNIYIWMYGMSLVNVPNRAPCPIKSVTTAWATEG